jgi:hypothetical protein
MPIGQFVFSEVSPAAAGTVASVNMVSGGPPDSATGIAYPLCDYDSVEVEAELKGATGGTLGIFLQSSDDGVNWFDVIAFMSLAAAAPVSYIRTSLSRYSTSSSSPVVVGKNLAPALAAGTSVQNGFGDRLRLVFVAGSGTTAGANQVVRLTGFRTETRKI